MNIALNACFLRVFRLESPRRQRGENSVATMSQDWREHDAVSASMQRDRALTGGSHGRTKDDVAEIVLVVMDTSGGDVRRDNRGWYSHLPAVVTLQHPGRRKRARGVPGGKRLVVRSVRPLALYRVLEGLYVHLTDHLGTHHVSAGAGDPALLGKPTGRIHASADKDLNGEGAIRVAGCHRVVEPNICFKFTGQIVVPCVGDSGGPAADSENNCAIPGNEMPEIHGHFLEHCSDRRRTRL